MICHMRHGSPPRLMALQSILSPNRRESLPTPSAGVRMTPDMDIDAAVDELGLPLVVKASDGSFSIGVQKARTAAEGARFLADLRSRSAVLVAQEYMPTDYDRRIGMLAGEPLFACRYFMAQG